MKPKTRVRAIVIAVARRRTRNPDIREARAQPSGCACGRVLYTPSVERAAMTRMPWHIGMRAARNLDQPQCTPIPGGVKCSRVHECTLSGVSQTHVGLLFSVVVVDQLIEHVHHAAAHWFFM